MAKIVVKNASLFAAQEGTEGTADVPAAGDAILAEGIAIDFGQDINHRDFFGSPGEHPSVAGAKIGTKLSATTELKGDGSTTIPEIDEMLVACFGSVVAADLDSTISGTSGSATVLDVAAATNATVGNLVMVETATADTYEVVGIIRVVDLVATPDDVTVSPGAVNGAYATNGKKVKEMRTYQVLIPPTAVNSMTFDVYRNSGAGTSRRDRLVGARGTFKMSSPKAGAIPKFMFDFMGWSWSQSTAGTRPTPTYDGASPKPGVACRFSVDGVAVNAHDIEIDLGAVVSQIVSQNATDGVYGCPTVDLLPVGSFKIHPEDSSIAEYTAWQANTQRTLMFQVGNTLYGTWCFYIPRAVITKVTEIDDSGNGALQIDWFGAKQNAALATSATSDAAIYLGVG